jgi:hypothetical protein
LGRFYASFAGWRKGETFREHRFFKAPGANVQHMRCIYAPPYPPMGPLSQKPVIASHDISPSRDNRTVTDPEIRAFPHRFKVVVCPRVHRFAAGRPSAFLFNLNAFEGRI